MNDISKSDNHISVCICTYKRPQMLSNLLGKLQNQVTENLFTYSVVVVDNDTGQTAKEIVSNWQGKSAVKIDYFCEVEQNISLARNKAVSKAEGNFLAFIDDDEFPENAWLINLLKTQWKYKADGVLGPVKPYFETEPPQWIIRGKICERPSFPTGTVLKRKSDTRTGNVLFNKIIFNDQEKPFNPEFGLTGGEDVDFFGKMMKRGLTFVWCNEARVYEIVPPNRFKKQYFLKRALLRGANNSKNLSIFSMDTIKSVIAIIIYTTALPFFLFCGHYLFMKYLIKDFDHIGKVLGLLNFIIVTKR